jgi:hypothetical protein
MRERRPKADSGKNFPISGQLLRSGAAVTELYVTCYGPTIATLRATDPDGASRLRQELTRLFQQYKVATDGITTVVGEYLDVQARVA